MENVLIKLSLIGDYAELRATSARMIEWMMKLQDENGFVPNIVIHEATQEKRAQFISEDASTIISILRDRIDVQYTASHASLSGIYGHIDRLKVLLSKVCDYIGASAGTRLAMLVDCVIPKSECVLFDSFIKGNNLNLTTRDTEQTCVEWSHLFNDRVRLKVQDKEEVSNARFNIELGTLVRHDTQEPQMEETKIGMRVQADINTIADNVLERFDRDSISSFAGAAREVFDGLMAQLSSQLGYNEDRKQ